ncbi:tail completion protein gp17 [Achromobacter spanius]|jgi:hypothetical protein|uniref:DUF3168 domain-containing protein n=1 Tax=Achromobacter spanius TaxID=217203 RepID=A0AA42LVL1_9BURK|nr:DUF3168 domain-containing protein [Achromobacter spanius]MDH0740220.1 DUF3168 domain-containing protein [Achromobacter spanius]
MVEDDIYSALSPLVGGGEDAPVYPGVAPPEAPTTRITYHWIGGKALNFLSGVPDKRNGRLQVDVWSDLDQTAARLCRQVEDALRLDPILRAVTEGGAVSDHEPDTGLYARKQSFSIWFTN